MDNVTLGTHLGTGKCVSLPLDKLTHHVAVVGQTGSGKTGMLMSLAEQYLDKKIPLILVDIKGDLCNVALQPIEVRNKMNFRVLTPGGTHGEPINLFADLQRPERVKNTVTQLLKMIRSKDTSPLSSRQHSFLSKLLHEYHKAGQHVTLVDVVNGILEPPFVSFGAMALEDAFPASARSALAAKLNNLLVAPSFEKWRTGKTLDVDDLYTQTNPDRSNVTVYSVAHLDEDEKMFALALLFDSIVAWMRKQRGTKTLKSALFVDECVDILPPYPRNPPTKSSLMVLLKQARAYGLGLVLATQNPMDIDYKAMGNCQTMLVGRLQSSNDRRRVVEAVSTVTSFDKNRLESRINRLEPREFVIVRPNSTADIRSMDVTADLIGPMTPVEISSILATYDSEVKSMLEAYRSLSVETGQA